MPNPAMSIQESDTFISEGAITAFSLVGTGTIPPQVIQNSTAKFPVEGIVTATGSDGKAIRVIQEGDWIPVRCGAAIAAKAAFMADGAGRAITATVGASTFMLGQTRTAGAAADDIIYVKLYAGPVNYNLT